MDTGWIGHNAMLLFMLLDGRYTYWVFSKSVHVSENAVILDLWAKRDVKPF